MIALTTSYTLIQAIYLVFNIHVLFCQPRVEVTSCFVYKVMGLTCTCTFHDRINKQLIYRFELAQVVARRITKPQKRFLFWFESHWLLFFYSGFIFIFGGGLNSYSRMFPNLQ